MSPSIFHRNLAAFAILAGALIAIAYAVIGYSIWASHQNSCRARDLTLNVMTGILMDAKQGSDANPFTPRAQKLASDAFLAHELARIHTARC